MMEKNFELPDCWWITPDIVSLTAIEGLLALLQLRIKQGISGVMLRQTQLDFADFAQVYARFETYCRAHAIQLLINGTPEQTQTLKAPGCFLNTELLLHYSKRPLSNAYWLGAYCHNLTELQHAQKLGLDFVSLSPVKKTLTHPKQQPLGWETFADLVKQTPLPVYALGGLSLSEKVLAQKQGAQGIMGIRFSE